MVIILGDIQREPSSRRLWRRSVDYDQDDDLGDDICFIQERPVHMRVTNSA